MLSLLNFASHYLNIQFLCLSSVRHKNLAGYISGSKGDIIDPLVSKRQEKISEQDIKNEEEK